MTATANSRRRRMFMEDDERRVLQVLRVPRDACIEVNRKAPIYSAVYRSADALIEKIDDVVQALTGDRKHFHLKPHGGMPE